MDREKAVDRAAKLQAQMESERKIGNSEAAEAFAAAMQRLLLKHALSEAEVAAAREGALGFGSVPKSAEPIVERRVEMSKAGVEMKRSRSASLEQLALIVAEAHLCRIMIARRSNQIWFVGTARHTEVAEYMFVVLNRALTKIAKDAYETFYHQVQRGEAHGETRGYISAFKRGFLNRLRQRYQDERQRVAAEHDASTETCTALVRLNTALSRVDDHLNKYTSMGALSGSQRSNDRGQTDGVKAANGIALRANAANGGTSKNFITA